MIRTSTIFLVLITGVTCNGGIDLTPSITHYTNSGMTIQQLVFKHDKQRIEYEPPRGWSFHGSVDRLQLTPPHANFAEAVIQAVPLASPRPLDEKVGKALEQEFIASLPPGSQFVTVVSEEQNPVLLNGNRSFELTVSYQLMGEKFLRSALFVNLADTQLIFRLTARKDDFESLHRGFRISISSWHWHEPDPSHDQITASASPQQISQSR